MTEKEWSSARETADLFESDHLWMQVSDRKYRLFAVACCRRIWKLMPAVIDKQAVEVAERLADGLCSASELSAITDQYERISLNAESELTESQRWVRGAAFICITQYEYRLASEAADHCRSALGVRRRASEERAQCDLIRDLFNPFHAATFKRRWRSSTVRDLARSVYEDRAFDRMPILADALEDAGCDDADILAHCRGDGPHVRGCWVVDLVLGKS